jgi:hypothetical protein
MTVLIVYCLLVLAGEVIVFLVGITADQVVPGGWNLILAMAMFFAVIAFMWPLAVFITERWLMPRETTQQARVVK